MKHLKKLLIVIFMFALIVGCKKEENETKPIDEPVAPETKEEEPNEQGVQRKNIVGKMTTEEYLIELEYLAAVIYDAGYCKSNMVDKDYCLITLKQLKEDYKQDISRVAHFNEKECNLDEIKIIINITKSSKEYVDTTLVAGSCTDGSMLAD